MKKKLMFLKDVYNHYRYFVPNYSSAALSFYLIILSIPSVTLIAIATSLLKIDLSLLESVLRQYMQSNYASAVIKILNNSTINTVSIVIIILSIYAVSRGVGNIYEISRGMFGYNPRENVFDYYLYVFKVTLALLIVMIGVVVLLASGPISIVFKILYSIGSFKYLLMFGLVVLFFMSIYMIVPKQKLNRKDAFFGANIAAIGMVLLYLFSNVYFKYANYKSVYGPLASVVIILFIFNIMSEIFYIGMYITFLLYQRRRLYEERDDTD